MKSQTLKIIAFIELIIGVIGSIAAGAIFKTVDIQGVLNYDIQEEFNFGLMLGMLVSVIVLFIILYALYAILSNVEEIRKAYTNENLATSDEKQKDVIEAQEKKQVVEDGEFWTCAKCGTVNADWIDACITCGQKVKKINAKQD